MIDEDIARSLLFAISNDIGQIASLYAMMNKLKKVSHRSKLKSFFRIYANFTRSSFIVTGILRRLFPSQSPAQHAYHIVFHKLLVSRRGTKSIFTTRRVFRRYWGISQRSRRMEYVSWDSLQAENSISYITRSLIICVLSDGDKYSWLENYAGSSGLKTGSILLDSNVPVHQLELDRWESPLTYCPLLQDAAHYIPDTVDLNADQEARYAIVCITVAAKFSLFQYRVCSPSLQRILAQMFRRENRHVRGSCHK